MVLAKQKASQSWQGLRKHGDNTSVRPFLELPAQMFLMLIYYTLQYIQILFEFEL